MGKEIKGLIGRDIYCIFYYYFLHRAGKGKKIKIGTFFFIANLVHTNLFYIFSSAYTCITNAYNKRNSSSSTTLGTGNER